jgi:CBS domain-containing protein
MKTWTVNEVMTQAVASVDEAASYRDLVDLLIDRRISAVPVVDAFQRVLGVVSEADLLRKIEYAGAEAPRLFDSRRRRGDRGKALARTAAELMSKPAVTALTGTTIAAAARLMDRENVKRLPVVDELGRLIGIVTRGDLLKVHLRPDDEIRTDVETVVLRRALGTRAVDVTVEVDAGVVTLTGLVERVTTAEEVVRLSRLVPGVVQVVDEVRYEYDDRNILGTGIAYGIA